jgi:hypothetical protein
MTKPDWSRPPACWAWDMPPLLAEDAYLRAAALVQNDMGKRGAVGGACAAWRFVQYHQGRCALCGRAQELVVDHDHWSGLIRGLLCWGCNGTEGREWTTGVTAFAGYRRRHPAAILGYREPYKAASTRVAFAATRERFVADWHRELLDLEVRIRHLASASPVLESVRPRWVKSVRRIERAWQEVASAGPLAADSDERVAALRGFLSVLASCK